MLDYQDMVCLAATQVWWTAEVENVFEKVNQVKLFLALELNNVRIRHTTTINALVTMVTVGFSHH
jgi:hypothetical protein